MNWWLWLPGEDSWDTVPNVCKISSERHAISGVWKPSSSLSWLYFLLLWVCAWKTETGNQVFDSKRPPAYSEGCFRRSALLSLLSHYLPSWEGGGPNPLWLPVCVRLFAGHSAHDRSCNFFTIISYTCLQIWHNLKRSQLLTAPFTTSCILN